MSHFTVLVIGDPDKLDAQLAPYDENTVVDPYWEDCWVPDSAEGMDLAAYLRREHPEYSALSDEEAVARWCEEGPVRKHEGRWQQQATYNPQSKWDWWVIGGRWTGFFKMKPDADAKLGRPGTFGDEAKPGYADQIRKGDIDIEGMAADKADEAERGWRQVHDVIDLHPPITPWSDFHAKVAACTLDIETARSQYHGQPAVRALREARVDVWEIRHFLVPLDDYRKAAIRSVLSPYALVKDGQWIGKGEMGWFGVSSGDMDQADWDAEVWKLIGQLPDDEWLTIVDAHI